MKKALLLTLGVVLAVAGINQAFSMMTAANTVENIIGLFLLVVAFVLACETKFLTDIRINIKKKKEDEENL